MTDDTQHPETIELLEDIKYVTQANKEEISQINRQFRQRITEAGLADKATELIIKELSGELGQLSVKVKLAEKAIGKLLPKPAPKPSASSSISKPPKSRADIVFGTDRLAYNKNLLPLESSGDGTNYLWSGADPEIQFLFPLNRSKTLGMRIRLFALIKSEYSRQLKILVDGVHTEHQFSVSDGLYVLSCNLPPASDRNETEVQIVLPATHSPRDLGNSNDERKLGLAIADVSFGRPEGGLTQILRRLKLKP